MFRSISITAILFGLAYIVLQEAHPSISEVQAKKFVQNLGYKNVQIKEDGVDLFGDRCSQRLRYYHFNAVLKPQKVKVKGYVCIDEYQKPFLMLF